MVGKYKILIAVGLIFFVIGLVLYFVYRNTETNDTNIDGSKTTASVKVYFPNKITDPDVKECDNVSYVRRDVEAADSVSLAYAGSVEEGELLYLALSELLKGPSPNEAKDGFYTSIPDMVKVKSIDVRNGIATVDFSEELNKDVAGSCRVIAIRSQLEKTAVQFDSIDSLVITVNNRSEDILQP